MTQESETPIYTRKTGERNTVLHQGTEANEEKGKIRLLAGPHPPPLSQNERDTLSRAKWREKNLEGRWKGDPVKLTIALRSRKERMMTVAWIAERLSMESRSDAFVVLEVEREKDES